MGRAWRYIASKAKPFSWETILTDILGKNFFFSFSPYNHLRKNCTKRENLRWYDKLGSFFVSTNEKRQETLIKIKKKDKRSWLFSPRLSWNQRRKIIKEVSSHYFFPFALPLYSNASPHRRKEVVCIHFVVTEAFIEKNFFNNAVSNEISTFTFLYLGDNLQIPSTYTWTAEASF